MVLTEPRATKAYKAYTVSKATLVTLERRALRVSKAIKETQAMKAYRESLGQMVLTVQLSALKEYKALRETLALAALIPLSLAHKESRVIQEIKAYKDYRASKETKATQD